MAYFYDDEDANDEEDNENDEDNGMDLGDTGEEDNEADESDDDSESSDSKDNNRQDNKNDKKQDNQEQNKNGDNNSSNNSDKNNQNNSQNSGQGEGGNNSSPNSSENPQTSSNGNTGNGGNSNAPTSSGAGETTGGSGAGSSGTVGGSGAGSTAAGGAGTGGTAAGGAGTGGTAAGGTAAGGTAAGGAATGGAATGGTAAGGAAAGGAAAGGAAAGGAAAGGAAAGGTATAVAGGAAVAWPIVLVVLIIVLIIVIIMIIVGIVSFFTAMPGMVTEKIKDFTRSFGNTIAAFFGADTTEFVDGEEVNNVLEYLESMGYDLYNEGFLTTACTTISDDAKKDGGEVIEGGVVKDNNGEIIEANSFPVLNYLISDNYVYTLSSDNLDDNYWNTIITRLNQFFSVTPGAFIANLISLLVKHETLAQLLQKNLVNKSGKGLLWLYFEENDMLGKRGKIYTGWGDGDITIDAERKILRIKGEFSKKAFDYSLDGWTGRYGMPLEFLLSVHLATQMPDLSYDMTQLYQGANATKIEILLHKQKADVTAAYNNRNGEKKTFEEFKNIKGIYLSREEAQKILIELEIDSPDDCTYKAAVFELLGQTDNGDGWIFDINYSDELKNKYGIDISSQTNGMAEDFENVENVSEESFKASEVVIKSDVIDAPYSPTMEKNALSFGYDSVNSLTTTIDLPKITGTVNGYVYVWNNISEYKKINSDTLGIYYEEINDSTKKYFSFDESKIDEGLIGIPKQVQLSYFANVKKTTRTWYSTYTANEKTYDDVEFEWITYKYNVYSEDDSSTILATYFIEYIKRNYITEELILKGILNEDGTTKSETKCSDDSTLEKCCPNCRNYVQKIYDALKEVNGEFSTHQPYISNVTNHWYRDVYYVVNEGEETYESSGINEDQLSFVKTDTDYETVMKERWTLYETDPNTGEYIYYKVNENGEIGEKFNGTLADAEEKGIKVVKKAKTNSVSELVDSGNLLEISEGVYSCYEENEGSESGYYKYYEKSDIEEGEEYKSNIYVNVKTDVSVAQVEEGLRTETNANIKKMFLNNYYFKYDGTEFTAKVIEQFRTEIFESKYGSMEDLTGKSGDALEKYLNDTTIDVTYEGKTITCKLADYVGNVDLNQDSLSAFSMLENTHTLDADYIYKDFKELIVELNYFEKEELTDETPRIFEFLVPQVNSYGWPRTALDKDEDEYGTFLHEKEDYTGGGSFGGYTGGETVVSPATGILLEYGTHQRENADVENCTEEVGYARILVLDDENYLKLESKLKGSASKAFTDGSGKTIDTYVNNDGKYIENSALKKDELTGWQEDDYTMYGYKEFAELYSEYGVEGYEIYVDGFKPNLPSTETNSGTNVDGEEITGIDYYISNVEKIAEYSVYEEDESLAMSDDETQNRYNHEKETKTQAAYVVDLGTDDEGNQIVLIKEGTVLGITYTSDELEAKRGTSTSKSSETTANKDTADSSEDVEIVGNYLHIILKDDDSNILENVEDYTKLDEDLSSISDWELFYWLPFESGGTDITGYGPECYSTCSTGETAAGIIQWTALGNMNNISNGLIKGCLENDSSFCSELSNYESWSVNDFWNDYNDSKEFGNTLTNICEDDREKFLSIQLEVAKEQYYEPMIEEYPWIESRPLCVQGELLHLRVWAIGVLKNFLEEKDWSTATDEEIMLGVRHKIANTNSTAGEASGDETTGRAWNEVEVGLGILDGKLSIEEIEEWVRTFDVSILKDNDIEYK